MALRDLITNAMFQDCIKEIPTKFFSTFTVIAQLERLYPGVVEIIRFKSPRNWRSVIGKAIKRFSLQTKVVKQISPIEKSPAQWEKR